MLGTPVARRAPWEFSSRDEAALEEFARSVALPIEHACLARRPWEPGSGAGRRAADLQRLALGTSPRLAENLDRKTLLAVAVGSAFLLLWAATRWPWNRREDANAFDLLFALSLTVALLVSYHLQVHDLSLLSLPIIIVLNDAISEDTSPQRLRVALMGASCAFLVSPVYLLLLRWGRLYLLFWPILLFAIGIAHRVAAAPRSDG